MPAKAAGTSMNKFTQQCTKRTYTREDFFNDDGFFRQEVGKSNQEELPKFMTSHVFYGGTLIKLFQFLSSTSRAEKNSINKSSGTDYGDSKLLIYLHRNEYDRFPSAVKQAASVFIKNSSTKKSYKRSIRLRKSGIEHTITVHNPFHATFEEGFLLELIQEKYFEIGMGTNEILNCEVHNTLLSRDRRPNSDGTGTSLALMDYKQVEELQKILAEQECPDLLEKPFRLNIDKEKNQLLTVSLKNVKEGEPNEITFDEWINSKKDYFESLVREWGNGHCQDRTKLIEDELFQCPNKFIIV